MNTSKEIKYFLYCRKSTEDKERQVLSLESQEEAMRDIAAQNRWKIVKTFHESKSAKAPDKRPYFAEMLDRIRNGEVSGIICWELSRLARNPDEAGKIMGMLQRGEIKHIKTYNKDFFSADNAVISSVEFGIANQYSRDVSTGVKRGINKKAAMGWRPGFAALGYLNTRIRLKGEQEIYSDPERFQLVKELWNLVLRGLYTVPQLLEVANEWGLTTVPRRNIPARKLHLSHLYKIFTNPFYYGWYEWPTGSGHWIEGKHQPMITADEFDRVQFLLGRKGKPRSKKHKFAFTGLVRCGSCRAMITAEEKFKHQKNGTVHHYIYYHCTKKINPDCEERTLELKKFEKQIDTLLERLTISPNFQAWALKYLHLLRKEQAETSESILAARQREYERITQQLNNLMLKFTAPENAGGALLDDSEYAGLRSQLLKRKAELEKNMSSGAKELEEWVELSERTFNFARYARIWFREGDMDTKRAIFACLGSNHLLQSQNTSLTLHKCYKSIFEKKKDAERELPKFEPQKNRMKIESSAVFRSQFPVTSG